MGPALVYGGRRGWAPGGRPRGRVPNSHTKPKRPVGRATLHGNGLSSGVLSTLSWLSEVLSARCVGAVSEPEEHQLKGGRVANVKLGTEGGKSATTRIDPPPVLIVTSV